MRIDILKNKLKKYITCYNLYKFRFTFGICIKILEVIMPNNYIHRTIELKLEEMYGNFPSILVTGARQSGKSTVLQYLAEKKNKL